MRNLYRFKLFLGLMVFMVCSSMVSAEATDHFIWDGLLKKHVSPVENGGSTHVNYAGFLNDRSILKTYLDQLSTLSSEDFDALPNDAQLAFLINAYNAWTVEFILTEYPDIESIKELGGFFSSPWSKRFIPLLGDTRSLDDIEHTLIRGSDRYQDVRIHFAVNCASLGCPALRAEAYTGQALDAQLGAQTRQFLSDKTRNRFTHNTLEVSSIFKWYRGDFEKGWSGVQTLEDFFANYSKVLGLSHLQQQSLSKGNMEIIFLEYDWHLNKQ